MSGAVLDQAWQWEGQWHFSCPALQAALSPYSPTHFTYSEEWYVCLSLTSSGKKLL